MINSSNRNYNSIIDNCAYLWSSWRQLPFCSGSVRAVVVEQWNNTHTQRDIESKSVRRVVDCPAVVGRRAVSLRRVNVLVFVGVCAIFLCTSLHIVQKVHYRRCLRVCVYSGWEKCYGVRVVVEVVSVQQWQRQQQKQYLTCVRDCVPMVVFRVFRDFGDDSVFPSFLVVCGLIVSFHHHHHRFVRDPKRITRFRIHKCIHLSNTDTQKRKKKKTNCSPKPIFETAFKHQNTFQANFGRGAPFTKNFANLWWDFTHKLGAGRVALLLFSLDSASHLAKSMPTGRFFNLYQKLDVTDYSTTSGGNALNQKDSHFLCN